MEEIDQTDFYRLQLCETEPITEDAHNKAAASIIDCLPMG